MDNPVTPEAFLYAWALDLLAQGDLPEARLVRRIVNAGRRRTADDRYAAFTPKGAQTLIMRLRDEGLLDEHALAQRTLHAQLGRKAGVLAVQRKLVARGLDSKVVTAVVAEFLAQGQPQDFTRIIALTRARREVLRRRYASDPRTNAKIRQGLYSFLALKGYRADEAHRILASLE